MNRIAAFLLCFLAAVPGAQAANPLDVLFDRGKAIPFYGPVSAQHQTLADHVHRGQFAEKLADMINSTLLLKKNLGIGFESCGEANAYFDPSRRAIIYCFEYIDLIIKTAKEDHQVTSMPREASAKVIDGVVASIFLHELGHAIFAINQVPITGREEDVADQFATWYSLNFVDQSLTPTITPSIWFWSQLAKGSAIATMSDAKRKAFMSDEHSWNEQRTANVACLALGLDPQRWGKAAEMAELSQHRAERCQGEYVQLENAMRRDFVRFFKIKPLTGRW